MLGVTSWSRHTFTKHETKDFREYIPPDNTNGYGIVQLRFTMYHIYWQLYQKRRGKSNEVSKSTQETRKTSD